MCIAIAGPAITPSIGSGAPGALGVPVQARPFYDGTNGAVMDANNLTMMSYNPLAQGGTYCYKAPNAKVCASQLPARDKPLDE
jgi:hypothetical protein